MFWTNGQLCLVINAENCISASGCLCAYLVGVTPVIVACLAAGNRLRNDVGQAIEHFLS